MMTHVSMQYRRLFEQKTFGVGRQDTQTLIAVQGLAPSLTELVYTGQLSQGFSLLSKPPLRQLQSFSQTIDSIIFFVQLLLTVPQLQIRTVHQKLVFRGFQFAFFDGLIEIFLGSFVHVGLSVEHADVVEQVGAIYFWELLIDFEGLGVVVEAESELIEMGIAAAQVVVLLSLLFEFFSLELATEVLDGFIIIFGAIVAVSNMEAYILILLDGGDSFFHAALQLILFLQEELQGSIVISLLVDPESHVEIVIKVIFYCALRSGDGEFVAVLGGAAGVDAG